MNAQLETVAHATDATHLELETPLAEVRKGQRMKVLITFETATANPVSTPDFRSAIGSYYRDFPQSQPLTTADYMQTVREGDAD
jgi:hypothetical protein